MIRQYYQRKFCMPFTWIILAANFCRFILIISDYSKRYSPDIKFRIVFGTDDVMVLFFFPLFLFYCFWCVTSFQRSEVVYRFETFQKAWYQAEYILLLESVSYICIYYIMVFLTYFLVNDVSAFQILFPKAFALIIVQCMTAFAYSLILMVFSVFAKNVVVGFLISYLFIMLEKVYVAVSGKEPVYFIGGMLFQLQSKLSVITIILLLATIVIFHFLGLKFYRNQDVLSKNGNQNEN
ncbi:MULTISPECIES: hypothetical protein [Caproicibacterium]|uniref:Uncharacterized protein n=1 Tax=Caproicibacterium argilliputei TaxID=3030016 RepID=A0AA97D7L7_9FIRM|nr:hypothetical protein [Caproicibacterium argilliputei]WOC31819.1 hypothetical protein PXC00_11565 [Caproicibacterium argilliputei]